MQVRSSLQAASAAFEAANASPSEKAELVQGFLTSDLPAQMLQVLPNLEFEAQKDVMRLFHQICQVGSAPVVEYMQNHQQVLQLLLNGCGDTNLSLQCHTMLRSCALHSELVICMLDAGFALELLKLAQHQVFDISSDAFCSLRQLLLTHKSVAASHLEKHFSTFFVQYSELLQSEDYVTKRQALRLLAEMLLDRKYKHVMLMYVNEEQFLQIQMNLLRENSRAIQNDTFHVFKVFAAAPNKKARVHQILFKNKDRLIKVVESLGKGDDESFTQDQKAVVEALSALQASLAK